MNNIVSFQNKINPFHVWDTAIMTCKTFATLKEIDIEYLEKERLEAKKKTNVFTDEDSVEIH